MCMYIEAKKTKFQNFSKVLNWYMTESVGIALRKFQVLNNRNFNINFSTHSRCYLKLKMKLILKTEFIFINHIHELCMFYMRTQIFNNLI